MKDKLCLFTSKFPFGSSEHFIEPELKLLSGYYNEIHIFPLNQEQTDVQRTVPENCFVHPAFEIENVSLGRLLKWKYFKICMREFMRCHKKWSFLRSAKKNLRTLVQCHQRANRLQQEYTNQITGADVYVFWMEDWATTMSFVKTQRSDFSFLCRVHGYDLFNERRPEGFIPWRFFQLQNCHKVVSVSRVGKEYLQTNFPEFTHKIEISHLGLTGNHEVVIPEQGEILTVVSCSAIIPLKRVSLLAELLLQLGQQVRWIHFGDGEQRKVIEKHVSGSSLVKAEFRGNVQPHELLSFYATTPVDVFIHVSESEGGVPLAIQEAVSFGIPVLGCNVGGVPEIVTSHTGILLNKNVTSAEFKTALGQLQDKACRNSTFRKNVYAFWKENFDLEKSTQRFVTMFNGN